MATVPNPPRLRKGQKLEMSLSWSRWHRTRMSNPTFPRLLAATRVSVLQEQATCASETLCLSDLQRQMQRLHPWAESEDESGGQPNCPSNITCILLHLHQEGRQRGKGGVKEGKSREGSCESMGLGEWEAPGEEEGEGTRDRENWKK